MIRAAWLSCCLCAAPPSLLGVVLDDVVLVDGDAAVLVALVLARLQHASAAMNVRQAARTLTLMMELWLPSPIDAWNCSISAGGEHVYNT